MISSYSDERGRAAGTVQFYHSDPHSEDVYGSVAFHPCKVVLPLDFNTTAYTL
jgi:hypothetical protein